ncbi:hypothetical protein [Aliiglaciecola sp. M165]|uniref:hypothetical protein n=1 Tax=Aliiglaciecola sp. M165 TaxID=2593649 RepID=UPI00117E9F38|nr:hypothetical protein [Aliiglaciecola sp. M165]TRY33371.1 hypothetical protein FM019_05185 [Aliiglaciecola sp. M165]
MSNSMQLTLKTTAKWVTIGWLGYLLLTIIGGAFITSYWMSGQDLNGLSQGQIAQLMEQDPQVALTTSFLAAIVAIALAFWITLKTQGSGFRTAMVFALGLIIYGAMGIVMHPDHAFIHQLGKLVAPLITCGLGAWLAIRKG